MKLYKCPKCDMYTLKRSCPRCGTKSIDPRPAKFSPIDRYGAYRRGMKREGLKDEG